MTDIKENKKIKICYVSWHCCIRVIKLSKALMKTGKYEIHCVANQVSYGTDMFDKFSFYHNKTQLANVIRDSNADIFIFANEPNWPLNLIREIKPDAKIILDAHDLDSIRQGIIPLDEFKAITNCNGILFVSKEVQEYILDLHKDQLKDKPTAVLEHYCNEEWHKMPMPSAEQRSGLVYEGGAESPPYKNKQFQYRHLYPVLQQLVNQGNEVHVIPGNADAHTTYSNIACFVYMPKVYPKLMEALRTKKYGLCVFNNPKLDQMQVNLTRTNKEQEYLSCGLPVIVCGAPATAKYIKENELGLAFDRLEDITPEVLEAEYPRLKANVDRIMPSLIMEKHIHILEKLIQDVLEG
jgi:hypothetical protein